MVIVLGQITEGDGCYGTVTPGLVETAEQSTAPLSVKVLELSPEFKQLGGG